MDYQININRVSFIDKQVIVEYIDPYQQNNIHLAISFDATDTVDNIRNKIIKYTPVSAFEAANQARELQAQNPAGVAAIEALEGVSLNITDQDIAAVNQIAEGSEIVY